MRRFASPFAVLCLFVLAAAVAPAAEEEIDLSKVSPADLAGPDVRETLARANAAYQEKRYEDAARAFVLALRANPGDSNSLYNLACCFGLMGWEKKAAEFLEASYRAGFHDVDHMKGDPDFERVRENEVFRETMARIEAAEAARAAASGERRVLKAEYLAEYRVVEPDVEGEPWDRVPLVVALHGYGDNAENFAGLFRKREIPQPFLFVVVETPYAFTAGPGGVGYSWTLNGVSIGADQRSTDLSERLVLDVIREVKREYRVDERRVFLMGFSQGGGMAFRMGVRYPGLFAGVIPCGGWFDPGEHSVAAMEKAAKRGRFLVCHSPDDRMVPFDLAEKAIAELDRFDVPYRLIRYEGGHSLPKALVEQIAAWIENPDAAAGGSAGGGESPSGWPKEKED